MLVSVGWLVRQPTVRCRLYDINRNRSRFEAEQVLDEFARSLQDRVDPCSAVAGRIGVVEETMEPSSLGIWVRENSASS